MAKERLSPSHPDWIWLQTPMNDLLKERSAPFDAKVRKKTKMGAQVDANVKNEKKINHLDSTKYSPFAGKLKKTKKN